MISFWVSESGRFGIEEYLRRRIPTLLGRLSVVPYEQLDTEMTVPEGAHIFAGLCQLSTTGLEVVASVYQQLRDRAPEARLLNDPLRVLQRFDLLSLMHAEGINRFNAYRAIPEEQDLKYPVFIREESGHGGALTGLLYDRATVSASLRALRARGFRLDQLLIVEFCDMSDANGVFRMASIYKIGDQIVPAFLIRGRHWLLKWGDSDHDEAAMREFVSYVSDNPHEAWARRIFAMAKVDYGRMDYGISGDRLQVWEINLNPTVGPPPGPEPPPLVEPMETLLWEGRAVYNQAMLRAFTSLDPERRTGTVTVRLDREQVRRVRAELRETERRRLVVDALHRFSRRPVLGWPLRTAYRRWLPRY